jgi:hypothetical protein
MQQTDWEPTYASPSVKRLKPSVKSVNKMVDKLGAGASSQQL